MFGRETISYLRDAADRVNGVGYDAQLVIGQLEQLRPQAEDAISEVKRAAQVASIVLIVVAACAVVSVGIYALRDW